MLSRIAAAVVPSLGHLTTTSDEEAAPVTGSIVVANHTSLVDPGIVLAALLRHGVEPVVLATAGLWRIPVLRPLLVRGGHVPVHRGSVRAAESLDEAATALRAGRHVLIYAEGRLPPRKDSAEAEPEPFRSGLARLALAADAPVLPLGQAGARRVVSGGTVKQIAGLLTAPARRPRLHVHLGAPVRLPGDIPAATAAAHRAVTAAWRTAAAHLAREVPGGGADRRGAAPHPR
ncbi:lysophospholipid acyltransferase family protein [Streptomyces sp. AM 2-1-1]|uniref:lysophospholipid acyltransferase family protein n=1 Tax=Streptomyces sp. AM 2-1-1 TaxID=3028709 RepID=UPI0023BA38A6|nr:lysophospholipid acyltransferase family protein [Streptomyces sp. AM 2-1-1]WEH38151.1 lysophospholipid acyltransferase family protein [Streptomyces sp. AM 2-1-1]